MYKTVVFSANILGPFSVKVVAITSHKSVRSLFSVTLHFADGARDKTVFNCIYGYLLRP